MFRRLLLFLAVSRGLASPQIAVMDDLQRSVVLPAPAQRVISLAPSITETLFALGAGDQVVGVTDFCNYPSEANTKNRVGGVINPNIETIISLKPDLIILSMEGNVREDFGKLSGLGVPVFVTNPRSLAGIHKSIADIGALTGRTENAERIVRTMERREDSIRALSKTQKRALLVVSLQPLIVLGSKTFLAELLELAGGTNIAGQSASTYPTLSREAVVEANPDIVIVMSDVLKDLAELLTFFPEWKDLAAIRNHHVFRVNSDIISRPGPRATDGLMALYRIIQQGHE
ncbi:MAG: Fe/B12 periplasmic-binding protein [Bacteroidetes bacterium]|nr:Fe/B12 periplasmic-binding protein [Bacteroidota bacterium]